MNYINKVFFYHDKGNKHCTLPMVSDMSVREFKSNARVNNSVLDAVVTRIGGLTGKVEVTIYNRRKDYTEQDYIDNLPVLIRLGA